MTGDMAQPSAPPEGNGLRLRVASAAVILPVAVGAVWLGSWWFALLLAAIGGAMGWEWARLCCPDCIEAMTVMPASQSPPGKLPVSGHMPNQGDATLPIILARLSEVEETPP